MLLNLATQTLTVITRRYPEFPGRWQVVRWLTRHPGWFARLAPRAVTVAPSVRMRINPADTDGRLLFISGLQQRDWVTRFFHHVLRPGDNVLDIGANVGQFTLLAGLLVRPGGSVHAFEASPTMAATLQQNAALNPDLPLTIHAAAVSDAVGNVEFHVASDDHSGLSSLRELDIAGASKVQVPATTLDALVDRLPPIHLVKVDVEGAEHRVLAGMRGLLERDRPLLLLELTDEFLRQLGSSAANVCAALHAADYRVFRLARRGHVKPLRDVPNRQVNVVAQHIKDTRALPTGD